MESVFEAAGGEKGLRRLAAAWHERVLADEVVSHAFSHGFDPDHTERLAAYWAEALGGPRRFTAGYGDESAVVRMHSGNGAHEEMDRRAVACFDQALADVGLTEQTELAQVLHDYFAWATTTTMAAYEESADDVPDGLPIPRWSWDGLSDETRDATDGGFVSGPIPSQRWPDALTALGELVHDARSLSIAVAFVTDTGAELLIQLLEGLGPIDIEVVARAGGVTSPSALRTLRDRLDARVSVAIGRDSSRFHPKLWLIRGDVELKVLSGSGNLTQGGMRDNYEQFELTRMPLGSEEATAHEERFLELTAGAYNLDSVEGTVAWSLWEQMITKSKSMRAELRRLEDDLARVVVKSRPAKEHEALLSDLYAIYDATVERNMITPKGRPYRPTRFLVGINRARDEGDPVELVSSLCSRQTGGFDIILEHGDPFLTVESLVVDKAKPYHHLFSTQTRERAAVRLRQFPSWQA